MSRLGYHYLPAPQGLRETFILTLRGARVRARLGRRFAGSPRSRACLERQPVALAANISPRGSSRRVLQRVVGGSVDVLEEAHEESAQDRNGAENDDEPHFRQYPRVQRVNRVSDVRCVGDGADGDCLADSRNSSAGNVSRGGEGPGVGWKASYITPPPMIRHRPILTRRSWCKRENM